MARPNQESIEMFMSITGVTEGVAAQKLEEHGGDLNAAVNAHFNEGERSIVHSASVNTSRDDLMDIDEPVEVATEFAPRRNPSSLFSEDSIMNSFSLLDPQFRRSILDGTSNFTNHAPYVSQPREMREIPIEFKDGSGDASRRRGHSPVIEDVTGAEHTVGPDIRGTVISDDKDDDDIQVNATAWQNEQTGDVSGDSTPETHSRPSAPEFHKMLDYSNDIEEEMVRAAIEASKQESQTAEQEKVLGEQMKEAGAEETGAFKPAEVDLGKIVPSNGRLETGSPSASVQDDAEDAEEPLVRHGFRRIPSGSVGSATDVEVVEPSAPLSPGQRNIGSNPHDNGNAFPSDEWGGISSQEHDEAVMLEAAMFGGIPEGTGYHFAYAPHQFMQTGGPYSQRMPRPPSPSLQAQRLIREQQDDEYLASLAADREKEMKAVEEAEARRLQEEAAREAALEEERRKEEESQKKLEEEQELERQLAAKEASLPQEPATNDENAVTLLVRMPDGARHGRRFLRSDKLQSLFDFIDIGRVVKPGTYRLVRPYPRRAFSNGESALTLNELGLTSKQEALFLELI
uniref:Uncharacterized protein MANES_01G066200 n=2 Tax=Rhizophora mucronata TaxID=61149 RepID=A0A2P2JGA1_RHIMU